MGDAGQGPELRRCSAGIVERVDHPGGDEGVGLSVDEHHGEGVLPDLFKRGCLPEAPAVFDAA